METYIILSILINIYLTYTAQVSTEYTA